MRRNDACAVSDTRAVSDTTCAIADTFCAVSDTIGARALSPYNPHAHARALSAPRMVRNDAGTAGRWRIVCRLLADPEREGYRLGALLERLPTERRAYRIDNVCEGVGALRCEVLTPGEGRPRSSGGRKGNRSPSPKQSTNREFS